MDAMNMDFSTVRLPFSETVVKLEPSDQLSDTVGVEGVLFQEQVCEHSLNIVQKLAGSLSCQKRKSINMANSSPSVRTREKSGTRQATDGEPLQLQTAGLAESAATVQPASCAVEVCTPQHGSEGASSDALNLDLPTSSVVGEEVTQGVLNEAMLLPTTFTQPQLKSASHSTSAIDHDIEKERVRGKEEGRERERVEGEGMEREKRSKEVTATTSSTGDQLAGTATATVLSLTEHTPVSSQSLSQQPGPLNSLTKHTPVSSQSQPGPLNWSDSQNSDAFYDDSQPPSLKMIRLESPSPSPLSPLLSLHVAQTDTQTPPPPRQEVDAEHLRISEGEGSPLSPLEAQTDAQSPRRQDPESSRAAGESTLSLLVEQMEAESTFQQDPNGQNVTKESSLVAAQTDTQSQQLRDSKPHHMVEQSPLLSQPIAQTDTQSEEQRDPEHQNFTEGTSHQMEISGSGGFLYNLPLDNREKGNEMEMEGERERIREEGGRALVGHKREKSLRGGVGSGEVFERGQNGHTLLNMFGNFKQKLQAGRWVKSSKAVSGGRGERSIFRGQRSPKKDKISHSATEQPSTSTGQWGSGDHAFIDQRPHGGENLGEGIFDEHGAGTLEVDVVGVGSQPATLEVDVEGTCSQSLSPGVDEMETTGAAPSRDAVQTQVQPSGAVDGARHRSAGEGVEKAGKKLMGGCKKMSLTIDKSKKAVIKKDITGNITMETPRHSQPPFQAKKRSPELYSQEYLHSSTGNVPAGDSTQTASSSRSNVGTTKKDISNFNDLLSKSTGSNVSSVGPSTSKAFTAQGDLSNNVGPSKRRRDASLAQNNASNSNRSRRKSPVEQRVVSFYGKTQESSNATTRSELSSNKSPIRSSRELFASNDQSSNTAAPSYSNNRSPIRSGRDLFASNSPSSNTGTLASTSKTKEAVYTTRSSRTKTNATRSSASPSPGKITTKLPCKRQDTSSATQPFRNVLGHGDPLQRVSPGRNHSESRSVSPSTSSSSVRQTSPDFEPYVRVIDPVYHDDPQLERWRQLVQAHWFEVNMVKSRQPLTMAEKRSLKQFGLLDVDDDQDQ